jgi:hypothetical protein
MTTNIKTAANGTPVSAPVGQPTPQDFQRFWGDRIMRTGVGGLGLGAGAASLYYLARGLSQALRDRKPVEEDDENVPATAVVAGNKMAGLYDNMATGAGKMLPDSLADFLKPFTPAIRPGKDNTFDPNVIRSSFGTAATLGAGALGTYGGYKLISALHGMKKKRDRQAEIDEAEQAYYDALTGSGGNKLASVYSLAGEKAAAEKMANPMEWLSGVWDTAKRVPAAVGGGYVAAGLGLGGLAAKLMYDRARERSKAKAVEEAARSKARIAGILPTYVDPDEIVALKQRAEHAQAG